MYQTTRETQGCRQAWSILTAWIYRQAPLDRTPPGNSHKWLSECADVCRGDLQHKAQQFTFHTPKSQQTPAHPPAHHARMEQQHSPLDLQPQNSNCGEHIPCLQKPLSYQGQSLIFDSGSMCKNGHSLLLHSPVPKANTLLSQLYRTEIKMTLKTLPGSCSSHRAVTDIFKFRHNSLTACLNLHEELQRLTPAEPSSTSLDYLFSKTVGELNLKEQSW